MHWLLLCFITLLEKEIPLPQNIDLSNFIISQIFIFMSNRV